MRRCRSRAELVEDRRRCPAHAGDPWEAANIGKRRARHRHRRVTPAASSGPAPRGRRRREVERPVPASRTVPGSWKERPLAGTSRAEKYLVHGRRRHHRCAASAPHCQRPVTGSQTGRPAMRSGRRDPPSRDRIAEDRLRRVRRERSDIDDVSAIAAHNPAQSNRRRRLERGHERLGSTADRVLSAPSADFRSRSGPHRDAGNRLPDSARSTAPRRPPRGSRIEPEAVTTRCTDVARAAANRLCPCTSQSCGSPSTRSG